MTLRRLVAVTVSAAAIVFAVADTSHAELVGFDANFGGTGIPNDRVFVFNGNGFTLALTAYEHCETASSTCGPVVTDDGEKTFFAQPGTPFPIATSWAGWNFGFYAAGDPLSGLWWELTVEGPGDLSFTTGLQGLGGAVQGNSNIASIGGGATLTGLYTITLRALRPIPDDIRPDSAGDFPTNLQSPAGEARIYVKRSRAWHARPARPRPRPRRPRPPPLSFGGSRPRA